MIQSQLTDLVCARPFRPFVIHLADSRAVPVNHPDAIANTGGRTAVVLKPDERVEMIDVFLVPSLEAAAVPSGSTGPSAPEGSPSSPGT